MTPDNFDDLISELKQWNSHSFDTLVSYHKLPFAKLDRYLLICLYGPPHYNMLFFKDDEDFMKECEKMTAEVREKEFDARVVKTLQPVLRVLTCDETLTLKTKKRPT